LPRLAQSCVNAGVGPQPGNPGRRSGTRCPIAQARARIGKTVAAEDSHHQSHMLEVQGVIDWPVRCRWGAMKKLLLGSAGLAALIAGPAMAADMPVKAPPPARRWRIAIGPALKSASTPAASGTRTASISRLRAPRASVSRASIPTSRPTTATASSVSTPTRSGNGAPGCWASKRP
jgi:hypothetical protein